MNIALLGYGKMGRAIAELAPARGHRIAVAVDSDAEWEARGGEVARADVAIEFSTPATAVANIRRCIGAGVPVVAGTTGWHDQLSALADECRQAGGALFVATNFSIGMNIVFEMNRRLAHIMNRHKEYAVSIEETHHVHKLDAPSGTAITLARDIEAQRDDKSGWQLVGETFWQPGADAPEVRHSEMPSAARVHIQSVRRGEVAGVHTIAYDGPADIIRLSHEAKGRQGLALGALLAAEFLQGKRGYFTMSHLLAFDE